MICGPAANSLNLLNGAWTHTWQGVDERFNTKNKLTILQALQESFGRDVIQFEQGSSLDTIQNLNLLLEKAKASDKIIVCLGETPCTEVVGNIDNLELPQAQKELVLKLATLNKPIILVCCFNRPRIIHDLVNKVDAVLYAYLPGDEGGRAIADCISGKINPSGKLPFTYPKAANALLHYDHKTTEELDVDFSMNAYRPEFDFGSGLSYSSFTYSPISLSQNVVNNFDSIKVSIQVSNTGKVKGKEVVQLYYKDLVASITPSVKKLCQFTKIELNPGETKTVHFTIHKNDFSFISKNLQRITEPGEIELQIVNQKQLINVN